MKNAKVLFCAAAAVLSLSLPQVTLAGPIVGSEALSGGNTHLGGSTDVTTATSATWTSFNDSASKTGDFSISVPDFQSISGSSTLELHTGAPGTAWTISSATWGTFVETSISSIVTGTNAITVYVQGNFTPGTEFDPSITGNTATMVLQMNQAGGADHAVSTGATLTTPALVHIPEPAGILLFGSMMGLVACSLWFHRKGSVQAF